VSAGFAVDVPVLIFSHLRFRQLKSHNRPPKGTQNAERTASPPLPPTTCVALMLLLVSGPLVELG